MWGSRALSYTKTLRVGRFNNENYKPPIIVTNIKSAKVEVNYNNLSKFPPKKNEISFDDLTDKELEQFMNFIV